MWNNTTKSCEYLQLYRTLTNLTDITHTVLRKSNSHHITGLLWSFFNNCCCTSIFSFERIFPMKFRKLFHVHVCIHDEGVYMYKEVNRVINWVQYRLNNAPIMYVQAPNVSRPHTFHRFESLIFQLWYFTNKCNENTLLIQTLYNSCTKYRLRFKSYWLHNSSLKQILIQTRECTTFPQYILTCTGKSFNIFRWLVWKINKLLRCDKRELDYTLISELDLFCKQTSRDWWSQL